nr:hypothetical protein [Tanacetum cinerariifolium]
MVVEECVKVVKASNYTEDCKVKFATGTLTKGALSWWNSYAKPIGIEQADKIAWTELKRLLTNKYCRRTKVKKMEDEFYSLVVKGNDLKTYARRLLELAVLCPNMPQTSEEAITIIQRLMDQLTKHDAEQGTNDHKRKFNDRRNNNHNNYLNNHDNNNYPNDCNNNNYQNNHNNNNRNNDYHQQANKRQETIRTYAANPTENKRSIKGNVTTSKPQTLEEAIIITQRLMVQNHESIAQQVALDEALVFTDDRATIGSYNMRIDPSKTQKQATCQVVLDILKLFPCYNAFLITTDVPKIYMQQFWFTISKVKDSSLYQFKLDKKKFRIGVELFLEILQICPKVPKVEFVAPPRHDAIVTFIKSLSMSKTEAEEQEEARRIHETHKRLITIKPISDEEYDESDAKPVRRPIGVVIRGAGITPKVPNDPKGKSKGISKGVGVTPEVPDVSKTKSTVQYMDIDDWGSNEEEIILTVESLSELVVKKILFNKMDKIRSYVSHDKSQELYDALLNSITLDESIASGHANPNKVLRKRDREETIYDVANVDQPLNHENDIDNADDKPDAKVTPMTDKFTWFKQPQMPPTPDPEWNKGKSVRDGPRIGLMIWSMLKSLHSPLMT